MELNRVEVVLEKYFEGETSISEEKELHNYFSSHDVAPHLVQYTSLFKYFETEKTLRFTQELTEFKVLKNKEKVGKSNFYWVSIAASVVVLLGITTYLFYASGALIKDNEFGTYEDPKIAFEATQKALSLLSKNVNTGIESVYYVEEYQIAKNRIFSSPKGNSEGM